MPDTIEDLRRLLTARIAEIDAEIASLEAGLRSLDKAAPTVGAAKKRKSRRRPRVKAGGSNKRALYKLPEEGIH
jgi:hypothetical protein